jgi:hypothetical protein
MWVNDTHTHALSLALVATALGVVFPCFGLVPCGPPSLGHFSWCTSSVSPPPLPPIPQGRDFPTELGLKERFIAPAMREQMDLLLVHPSMSREEVLATLRAMIDAGKLLRA